MKRLLLTSTLGSILILTGCASGSAPTAVDVPTQSPEPIVATEKQVASVFAEYESDWRETMDGAGECRMLWVFEPGSLPGMTCWLQEQTLSTTAEIVIRDVGELEVPSSMVSLVSSTTSVLQDIVDVDAKTICDAEASEPADSDECNQALGSLNFHYTRLESELDAWRPYL
ncbi:hypothetical protein [Agromyces archimandritae]|uniref:Lipoprotein n=1 Tax=Agromyces archimandritae TaxID=2781962 RepID=A0A975FQA3_9MICO|nr:hypothetical protein [Agromyces archimandritae]QTX05236.1 hypothetical protein G127AT_03130 [Agromyces archimandritae]